MIHPTYDTMKLLMSRASDKLSHDDLMELASLADTAADEALHLSGVITNVACLVAGDAGPETKSKVGSFQDHNTVFLLLCHLATSLDTIAGMTEVSVEARDMLTRRHRATN
ncbi:MAG: hypothetical protein JNK52_05785 [Zoogloeaceae bacterium]|nr:hypothetical protein [Zoogloeaceae bacterium]